MKTFACASAVTLILALPASMAIAAPDLNKAEVREVTLFYPGVTPIEWITKGSDHSGAKGLKKGEQCIGCHEIVKGGKVTGVDIDTKRTTSDAKLEPKPIKGKAGSIPVSVAAANDGTNLYIRMTWKQPAGGGEKMDADNPVKVAFMLEGNKVERASQSGCWETCHGDAQTMPQGVANKTKYVPGGALGSKYYDIYQWKSGKGEKGDGSVSDKRVMTGGTALVEAKGEKKGDTWTVTFVRKLAGGGTDMPLEAGKVYNIGFAIHDDHTSGRFHHVSFGYHLGIDTKADIVAAKQ